MCGLSFSVVCNAILLSLPDIYLGLTRTQAMRSQLQFNRFQAAVLTPREMPEQDDSSPTESWALEAISMAKRVLAACAFFGSHDIWAFSGIQGV